MYITMYAYLTPRALGVIQAPAHPPKAALSEHTAYIYSTVYHT